MVEHGQHGPLVGRIAACILAGAGLTAPASAECRQALALGLDVSGSVDETEYGLQLYGLAMALDAPAVRRLILSDTHNPVRLLVYEWSGLSAQVILVPWIDISDGPTLDFVIASLLVTERRETELSTAIGAALLLALAQMEPQAGCWKRTIDLSGDGRSNMGIYPELVEVPPGIIVNGLVIGGLPGMGDDRFMDIKELSSYYLTNVIRGPGAFVETALGFTDFEAAMTRKLIRELQGVPIGMLPSPPGAVRLAGLGQ